jgi:histone deacetylase 1/2
MSNKSCVSRIFPQFKHLVEKKFHTKIKSIYSDNGGEFVALKQYFSIHRISHYTTTPHTPQQNGVSERHHRHLVETGLTLLHDASLPLSYWPHAFSIAAYLINRQPTPLLQNKTPFETLFRQPPNYLKLKKFGCRCFPLTKPYNTNKLQPKATTCLFLGYSTTQNAYKCLDLSTNKLYLSRHVLFDESHSPFQALSPAYSSSNSSSSVAMPLIGVPAPPQPSLVILDRATISASPSGTTSTLPFSIEEHVPFNSSCYSPIVVHHSKDLTSSPILPLTPASLSPPTTDVAIPA